MLHRESWQLEFTLKKRIKHKNQLQKNQLFALVLFFFVLYLLLFYLIYVIHSGCAVRKVP